MGMCRGARGTVENGGMVTVWRSVLSRKGRRGREGDGEVTGLNAWLWRKGKGRFGWRKLIVTGSSRKGLKGLGWSEKFMVRRWIDRNLKGEGEGLRVGKW